MIFLRGFVVLSGFIFVSGCADLSQPYNQQTRYDPYPPPSYDTRYDNYRTRQEWERRRTEELELKRERERLRRERRQLEEERRRIREHEHSSPHRPVPRPTVRQQCPPGFSPSERKCTAQERKRGCKDIRLNSGLGCVHR